MGRSSTAFIAMERDAKDIFPGGEVSTREVCMEPIRYPFRWTGLSVLSVFGGCAVLAIIIPAICFIVFLAGMYLIGLAQGQVSLQWETFQWQVIPILFGNVLCAGFFLYAGILIIYMNLRELEASLTAETLVFGPKGRPKILQLKDIVSVRGKSIWWARWPTWRVTIQDARGGKIEMMIGYSWGRVEAHNPFPCQTMLRDLLLRLPASAVVGEEIRTFVETGRIAG